MSSFPTQLSEQEILNRSFDAVTNALRTTSNAMYDVRTYGAIGNGSIDDSVSIKNACAAAAAVSGTVYVPHGTYMINPDTLGVVTCSLWGESKAGTIFKLVDAYNGTNNIIRVVSASNLTVGNFTIDGNKANQSSGTQYGLYISTTTDCGAMNIKTKNCTGVGQHFYNNTRLSTFNCHSTNNSYHSFEYEQNVKCSFTSMFGYASTLNDHLVSPGEVGGTGSKGNTFTNLVSNNAGQYGLAFNAANGDVSAWLSEGDTFNGISINSPTQYGLNIYKQDKMVFTNLYINNAGYFSVYLFQSQYNTFNNFFFHNGSQSSNGAYDEILIEGYSANNAHPSKGNVFNGGQIIIDGAIKARYAYNEATSSDGPNTFVNVNVPSSGTSGKVNQVCPSTIVSNPGGVLQIGDNGQAIQGANAGLDTAFSHVMRVYNNFSGGITQVVNPNGAFQAWVGGTKCIDIATTGYTRINTPSSSPGALPDNGTIALYLDEVGNNLKVAVKYSDGTTKTGTIALV